MWCKASEKECRMQCRAAPIMSSSYLAKLYALPSTWDIHGWWSNIPPKPNLHAPSFDCSLGTMSRSSLLWANQAKKQFQIVSWLCHPKKLSECSPKPRVSCSRLRLLHAFVRQGSPKLFCNIRHGVGPLAKDWIPQRLSRNFGSTPIDNESSVAPRWNLRLRRLETYKTVVEVPVRLK